MIKQLKGFVDSDIQITAELVNAHLADTDAHIPSVIRKSATTTLTTEECSHGNYILVDGAYTITLDAVANLENGTTITLYSEAASVLTVAPNSSDSIRILGSQKTDGTSIASGGTLGASITVFVDSADGWSVLNSQGTWT